MTLELSTTTTGGAPTPHQRRLSDKALDLIGSHLSPNTRRAYTSDLAQVFQWLVDTDRARPIDLELDKAQELAAYSTLTATSDPQVIVEYIADQAGTLKPSTIARRVAATRIAFSTLKVASPCRLTVMVCLSFSLVPCQSQPRNNKLPFANI